MITYLLIVALVLFAITLWYFTMYLAQLSARCGSLELKLEVYRYEQELAQIESEEALAREMALQNQRNRISGKILEQYCPFAPEYTYNPDDSVAVFDAFDYLNLVGKSANKIVEIVFQEMKSGVSKRLTSRQRQIRDCIQAGKVRFELWWLDGITGKWHLIE